MIVSVVWPFSLNSSVCNCCKLSLRQFSLSCLQNLQPVFVTYMRFFYLSSNLSLNHWRVDGNPSCRLVVRWYLETWLQDNVLNLSISGNPSNHCIEMAAKKALNICSLHSATCSICLLTKLPHFQFESASSAFMRLLHIWSDSISSWLLPPPITKIFQTKFTKLVSNFNFKFQISNFTLYLICIIYLLISIFIFTILNLKILIA